MLFKLSPLLELNRATKILLFFAVHSRLQCRQKTQSRMETGRKVLDAFPLSLMCLMKVLVLGLKMKSVLHILKNHHGVGAYKKHFALLACQYHQCGNAKLPPNKQAVSFTLCVIADVNIVVPCYVFRVSPANDSSNLHAKDVTEWVHPEPAASDEFCQRSSIRSESSTDFQKPNSEQSSTLQQTPQFSHDGW